MSDRDDGCFMAFLVVVGLLFLVGTLAYGMGNKAGYDRGVRDHAEGRAVIDKLSDGSTVVTNREDK